MIIVAYNGWARPAFASWPRCQGVAMKSMLHAGLPALLNRDSGLIIRNEEDSHCRLRRTAMISFVPIQNGSAANAN